MSGTRGEIGVRGYLRRTWLIELLVLLCLGVLASRVHLRAVDRAQALGLPAGWNLIANPNGLVTTGPAYTFQMGDTEYETVSPGTPLVPGLGYWVVAPSASALPLGAGMPAATLLTNPGQFIMAGNPSGLFPAVVSGADVLLTYDPARGGYQQDLSGVLAPGQGAWALSFAGTPITIVAQGTSTATCSTAETGSACPVNGACPQGYPVAITADAAAHPQPQPGDPALQGTPVLCFNDISQALTAGYRLAPQTRLILPGPVSATVSNMRFTVLQAMLESPDAFMARVLASGDQLCTGCDVSGATAIVTVQYGIENLNRPATLASTGTFVSAHSPAESSPSYFLLQSQHAVDPVHNGVPVAGAISGVFTRSPFASIDQVNWRLDNPLIDASSGIPQPHGPSVLFELDFRGPRVGQVLAYGGGSAPLPPYSPYGSVPPVLTSGGPTTSAPAAGAAPAPGPAPAVPANTPAAPAAAGASAVSNPAPVAGGISVPSAAATATPAATATASSGANPNAPFTR
jgi:hypothetical protein